MQMDDKKVKMYYDREVSDKTEVGTHLCEGIFHPFPQKITPSTDNKRFWKHERQDTQIKLNQIQHQRVVLFQNKKFDDVFCSEERIKGIENQDGEDKTLYEI